MSALTKIAVVLLVVASLLLSAGVVVFVNKVEDFRAAGEAADLQYKKEVQKNTALASENKDLRNQGQIDRTEATARLDAARAESANKDPIIAKANADIARGVQELAARDATIVTMTNVQKGLQDQLDKSLVQVTALRTNIDKVVSERFSLNTQLTDALSKLDVVNRAYKDLQERYASKTAMYDDLERKYKVEVVATGKAGRKASGEGVPALEGVVSGVFSAGNKPWAQITIGSKDNVEKGMQFKVVNNNEFLGYLTIQTTEPNEAAGVLEGPKVEKVRQGDQVKTQLQ